MKHWEVNGPNEIWVADLTYIQIATCFVYLAVILDLFSRRVVGWAIARSMSKEICQEAASFGVGVSPSGRVRAENDREIKNRRQSATQLPGKSLQMRRRSPISVLNMGQET